LGVLADELLVEEVEEVVALLDEELLVEELEDELLEDELFELPQLKLAASAWLVIATANAAAAIPVNRRVFKLRDLTTKTLHN